ncbi:MAG: winged helix-turn-helix transcriptional regulator [Ferruginibacter sp.]|nr:winged helix-turn-helix transcriptional regulator [Ferruginibacter sp.]
MKGQKVIEVVNLFGEFHSETGSDNVSAFSIWLNRRLKAHPVEVANTGNDNRTLVWLIHRLSKMFRWYAKDILQANGISSIDEYFFLISINKIGTPSKTEVYADTITEINTGTQMMKRMIRAGLIEETADRQDKRVHRVKLTPKGKKTWENFFQQSVSDLKLKAGNLSETEKKELIRLLTYLEKFHTDIYFNDSGLSVEEMIGKHLL